MKLRKVTLPDGTISTEVVPPSPEEIEKRKENYKRHLEIKREADKKSKEHIKFFSSLTLDEKIKFKKEKDLRRFWGYVDVKSDDECWFWNGAITWDGYGQLYYNGRKEKAHRVAYMSVYGEITKDKSIIMHTCNNRKCCNPKHLKAGTNSDNLKYMFDCGRDNAATGERHGHAKRTWELINEIREKYLGGDYTQIKLCREYNIDAGMMSSIINNRYWRDEDYKKRYEEKIKEIKYKDSRIEDTGKIFKKKTFLIGKK